MAITRNGDQWQPEFRQWGGPAYEETKEHFFHLVMESMNPQAQAFAVWALAQDPELEGEQLLRFGGGCDGDRPTPEQVEIAKQAIGIRSQPGKKRKPPSRRGRKSPSRKPASRKPALSGLERAILADFSEAAQAVEAYRSAQAALADAKEQIELAKAELRQLEEEKAQALARYDPEIATILRDLGVLLEPVFSERS